MESIEQSIWAMILSGILALFICALAYQKGFFHLPEGQWKEKSLRLLDPLVAFVIFFVVNLILTPNIYSLLKYLFPEMPILGYFSWITFLTYSITILGLVAYLSKMDSKTLKGMIKSEFLEKQSIFMDILMGILACIIVTPVTIFFGLSLELILTKVFTITFLPDQSAVAFLKKALNYPAYFIPAALTVSILAPVMEELLFRGFLQSYLRKFLRCNWAIILSSIVFALFHFNLQQKEANFLIIPILFIMGLMLGFIYERQRSLYASISLHATYNIMNIVNIIILKDLTPF